MSLSDSILQVKGYDGPGYRALVDFESWRVALFNPNEKGSPADISFMERHNQTDEVFVLLAGRCVLLIGEGSDDLGTITAHDMEPHKLYNVRKAVWHAVSVLPESRVLIVENRDTTKENSSYTQLSDEIRAQIAADIRKAHPDA